MESGEVDAWIVHLAEGVRDGDRRPGDTVSSRAEFQTLKAKGLLTDMTVIIHGTALERSDFAEMRAAPTIRTDGVGDGRGAKLVWSPLSNMLLYGETANVYEALAEGVLTSLGTDWAPSGSRTLLQELKIADVALRDERVLGSSRELVPAYSLEGKQGLERQLAEAALDRALVDMVTRNPALTLRWYDRLGSVEAGKIADLLLLRRPPQTPARGLPPTVYRDLIDATEREVELVLVGGDPLAGDVQLMSALKPGDYEVDREPRGRVPQGGRRHDDGARARGRRAARRPHGRARARLDGARRRQPASRRRPRPANQHLQLPEGERRRRAGGGPSRFRLPHAPRRRTSACCRTGR